MRCFKTLLGVLAREREGRERERERERQRGRERERERERERGRERRTIQLIHLIQLRLIDFIISKSEPIEGSLGVRGVREGQKGEALAMGKLKVGGMERKINAGFRSNSIDHIPLFSSISKFDRLLKWSIIIEK